MKFLATPMGSLKFDYKNSDDRELDSYLNNSYKKTLKIALEDAYKVKLASQIKERTYASLDPFLKSNLFIINFNRNELLRDFSIVKKAVQSAINMGCNPSKILCNFPMGTYNFEEINNLIDIRNDLLSQEVNCTFEGSTMEEVLLYNKEAREFIDKLKKLNIDGSPLSPLENFMIIYRFVANRDYKNDIFDEHHSRNFISAFKGDYSVCAGFAQLLETLCSEMGISCPMTYLFDGETEDFRTNGVVNHGANILDIKDDKYGIHGFFYNDTCTDRLNDNNKTLLSMFMIPLSDLQHLNEGHLISLSEFEIAYFNNENTPSYYNRLCGYIVGEYKDKYQLNILEKLFINRATKSPNLMQALRSKEITDEEKCGILSNVFEAYKHEVINGEKFTNKLYYKTVEVLAKNVARAESMLYNQTITEQDILSETTKNIICHDAETGEKYYEFHFDPRETDNWMSDMIKFDLGK